MMVMSTLNKFAICIFSDENSLLTPRRIYQVVSDKSAEHSDYVRVIDDEGEDYLYPKNTSFLCRFRRKLKRHCFRLFKLFLIDLCTRTAITGT